MSGNGVSGLPALSLGARLRRVRPLAGILPRLGVSIAPSDNGTVNVSLPAEVAELFILDLEKRAKEWQEAMRAARLQEIERNADLKAATGEGRRQWEAQGDAWGQEYLRLRNEGKGHWEALHIIRGPLPYGQEPQITTVLMGVQQALGRLRKQRRKARDEEICQLAREGLSRQAIADALRINYSFVLNVLKRAGIPVPDARHDRRGAIGAPKARKEG